MQLERTVMLLTTNTLPQCFKDSHDQLNVSYSLTPAFG